MPGTAPSDSPGSGSSDAAVAAAGPDIVAGYHCPCHGSVYDAFPSP